MTSLPATDAESNVTEKIKVDPFGELGRLLSFHPDKFKTYRDSGLLQRSATVRTASIIDSFKEQAAMMFCLAEIGV